VPQAGEDVGDPPAFGADVGFADVEEVAKPRLRGNSALNFRKRTVRKRVHELATGENNPLAPFCARLVSRKEIER